ncbi:MAG: hypothetical protein AVDCRST_MAG68-1807 [uncultured Gemmatimonadetes bacterium]|uniref:Uncharacterized protein n=1 Tax=uncultured Gemmatimonadota bacterium TaxID=203437 RepID=A0A6J4K494_9BACT|nr:MAG: hypothetical protein AVDCRST_MAG68-1807 [uncultured Gemmatimonadota bacterium]
MRPNGRAHTETQRHRDGRQLGQDGAGWGYAPGRRTGGSKGAMRHGRADLSACFAAH